MDARSKGRALSTVAIVFTLALWTINFGLVDLVDGLSSFVDQQRNPVLDVAWGALFGIIAPLGLLAQVRRAEGRIAGVQQVALVAVALGVAGLAGEAWGYVALAAGLFGVVAVVVVLHPARRAFIPRRVSPNPALLLSLAVVAFPCIVYARRMAAAQRDHLPPSDAVSNGLHHWSALGALALTVVLLTALAALGTQGWWLPLWGAGLGALVWSVSCLRYPSAAGSEGRSWAWAVLAWAIATVISAYATRSGEPAPLGQLRRELPDLPPARST